MVTGAPMSILKSCEEAGAETAGSCVPLKHVAEMPAIMLQGAESASLAASMRLPGVTVKLPMKSPSAGGSFSQRTARIKLRMYCTLFGSRSWVSHAAN